MVREYAKQTRVALQKAYQFVLWLISTTPKRKRQFLDRFTPFAMTVLPNPAGHWIERSHGAASGVKMRLAHPAAIV